MTTKTPIVIEAGWLKGHFIRRARKDHRCDYWWGASNGGRCVNTIKAGDLYVEGEMNDRAGGFGNDRYCLTCASVESKEVARQLESIDQ